MCFFFSLADCQLCMCHLRTHIKPNICANSSSRKRQIYIVFVNFVFLILQPCAFPPCRLYSWIHFSRALFFSYSIALCLFSIHKQFSTCARDRIQNKKNIHTDNDITKTQAYTVHTYT